MNDRARAALQGALVADAAALGLHWLYDPERLAQVAGDAPTVDRFNGFSRLLIE